MGTQTTKEKIGYYVCCLIDILGQKESLFKLNSYKDVKNNQEEINEIFRKTYGNVKKFRNEIDASIEFINKKIKKHKLPNPQTSHSIKIKSFSDLIINYILLGENTSQSQGIYFLLISNCMIFLNMLAKGIPLRGGIDIGLAIETENEIYGTALLKPYVLESQVAKSIRIVVGQELYNYIQEVASHNPNQKPIKYNVEYARLCQKLIKKDNDSEYILDYLSDEFHSLKNFQILSKKAKEFLEIEHNKLRINGNFEVAKKYQKAIEYFKSKNI